VTIQMCRSMFTRFSRGQELLRRNHGVPVLHQQDVLDQFIRYLNTQCRVPAEVVEMLQHMRDGSLMNTAGGTSGGRLPISSACMNKEPAFIQSVCQSLFGRSGETVRFELFPSTTKSIEALVSLLAYESEIRERPIKFLIPCDAHYCWGNVASKYESHPYLKFHQVIVGSDLTTTTTAATTTSTTAAASKNSINSLRLRDDDFVITIFTFANTVSGKSTEVKWFEDHLMQYVKDQTGTTPHIFVDAALSGCVSSHQVLDLRIEEGAGSGRDNSDSVRRILDSALGLVQSGFKDYGLSSMLFLDDAALECCSNNKRRGSGTTSTSSKGLALQVAGGSHPLIQHAPVTSIPESPTLAFLIFAREYTEFRCQSYKDFVQKIQNAIPVQIDYELILLFPLLKVKFGMDMMEDEHDDDGKDGGDGVALVKELTEALIETYSLITIDAEPNVVRLWPTPTNHDIADAIADWFENEYYIFTAEAANHGNDGNDGDDGYSYQP